MPIAIQPGRVDPLGDLGDFTATPRPMPKPRPDTASVRAVSEALNFPEPGSRAEGDDREGRGAQRRHRTGRNVQLNIKATAETVERFNRLTAAQGWVSGETLERALVALEATLKA